MISALWGPMADRFDICERMRMEDDILMMNEESLLNGDVDVDVDLIAARSVAARSVAARSVAVRDVAADSVAARTVAVRDVAAGFVAAGPVAADSVAAGSVAAGSVAAGPVAAGSISSKQNRQDYRPRGRAAGARRQQERFMQFLYQLSMAPHHWGRHRERGRGRKNN
ncbi:histone H1-like protein HC2 [Linepithema humile]|uniref:histone H1-like protein HC2 n=1 Tax=Linepithema humile TaxID=83485 RepID=UPI00351E282A